MLLCRPCNALESIFVQCNIRFAAGVSFVEPVSVEKAEMALLTGLQVSGLDRLDVILDEDDSTSESSWRVALFESPTGTPQRISRSGKSLTQSLDEIVARDTPALGGVASYILINATDDNDDDLPSAFGVMINANHALCDGQRMKACFEALLQNLMGARAPLIKLGALGDLTDASTKAVVISQDPRFLPLKSSLIVKLNEIPQLLEVNPSQSSVTSRRDIDASIVKACRHRLQSKEATVTGFMMACLIQAISEVAAASTGAAATAADSAPAVSISCLVGLGSQLSPALYTNAFGTVTASGFGSLLLTTDGQHHDLASLLVDLAESCTQDLQTRIQRGEALSQCLALCRGEFDNVGPPGTVELSNHGMYHTTALTEELALQQRYDGYDGVSVSMVSESNSGKLRLTANGGAMFRRAAILGLLERVAELWHLVAAM